MQRKFTILAFLGLIFYGGYPKAQPSMSFDSLKVRYEYLEPYVETGILIDRNPQALIAGPSNFSPLRFAGQDSSCNGIQFEDIYELMYHAAYQADILFGMHPNQFDNELEIATYGQIISGLPLAQTHNLYPKVDMVMGLLALKYQQITSTAWDSSYITIDTNTNRFHFNDRWHLTDTVYLDSTNLSRYTVADTTVYRDSVEMVNLSLSKHLVMALAGMREVVFSSASKVTFYFPENFLIQNLGLDSMNIDFGDGNGYRSLPSDSITITYPSFGTKIVRLELRQHNPSLDLDQYPTVKTEFTLADINQGKPGLTILLPGQRTGSCTVPMPEGIGTGRADIWFRHGADSTDQRIIKPVIIVEGFESISPVSETKDKCDGCGCGNNNWASFSSGVFSNEPTALDTIPEFIDSLRTAGYDVVLLDLETNRATIQKNGNLLINLIQEINIELDSANSDEEIVLIGASMGGLIARYGARKMEMKGCCHNIRLYVTFSTPHRGANIPLGIQEFIYALGHDLNAFGNGDPAKEKYKLILNSPASRQMLVYHRDSLAKVERDAFMDLLDSLGHPQQCRRIALTNGSVTAIKQNDNGKFLSSNSPLVELIVDCYAPVTVPGIIVPILSIASLTRIGKSGQGGIWPLIYAKAYTIGNYSGSGGQLELERGASFHSNHFGLWQHLIICFLGTVVFLISLLTHDITFWTAVLVSLASFGACITCPWIAWSKLKSSLIIGAFYSGILVLSLIAVQSQNPHTTYNVYSSHSTLAYDNAPGDYIKTPEEIVKLGKGLVKAYYPRHTFITSTSALDIDTTDIEINIRQQKIIEKNLTPFQAYWALLETGKGEEETRVSENTEHVEIRRDNIHWLMDQIRKSDYHLRDSSNLHYKQLQTYYNFAKPNGDSIPYQNFLKSVDIQIGGKLYVNKNDQIGYLGSQLYPKQSDHFELATRWGACDSTVVRIQNGGFFTIGDNNLI